MSGCHWRRTEREWSGIVGVGNEAAGEDAHALMTQSGVSDDGGVAWSKVGCWEGMHGI